MYSLIVKTALLVVSHFLSDQLVEKLAGKMAKKHFCYGSLRGQAQVRPIEKLDESCTNAEDRMMLVQHCSADRVMS